MKFHLVDFPSPWLKPEQILIIQFYTFTKIYGKDEITR